MLLPLPANPHSCTNLSHARPSPQEVLSCPDSFDVAVTTYDTIRSPHWGQVLSRTIRWRYLVMDEGHRIKNEDTLISNAMRHVQ